MGRIVPYMKWKIKNVGNHQPEHLFKLKYTWCAWHVQTDLFIEAFLLSLWWLVISSLHLRGAPFLVSRKPRCLRPWKNQTAAVTLLTKYWHSFSNSCAVIFFCHECCRWNCIYLFAWSPCVANRSTGISNNQAARANALENGKQTSGNHSKLQ